MATGFNSSYENERNVQERIFNGDPTLTISAAMDELDLFAKYDDGVNEFLMDCD